MKPPPVPLIAHVIFRLDVGGLENGLVNLINGLPHDEFNHAIICIDRSTDFAKRIDRDDVEIIEIRKRPGFDVLALWRLYKTIKALQPDILHTRNIAALDALLPGALAGVRHRIHGEHGWDVNDLAGTNRKLRWLRSLHSPLVTRYVTVSSDLRNYLVNRVGIDVRRVSQIYNGVDVQKFRPNPNKLKDRLELNPAFLENAVLFGTVGRMQAVKGHTILAKAFVRMITSHPDLEQRARLVIVGDGDERQEVSRIVKQGKVGHLCWFPGYRDDVPKILSCFDVYVQPSLAEGVSNTILEAMACGIPIIATNVGGNPELIQDGLNGCIVARNDPGSMAEAMRFFAYAENETAGLGLASRRRALELFSFKLMMDQYRDLYRGSQRRPERKH